MNWMFFPGGPGLGPEYLEGFLIEANLKGSIFVLKYPSPCKTETVVKYLSKLNQDILEFIKSLPNLIIVGHSYGGMLLQCLNLKCDNIKKQILLNSSPTLECFSLAAKSAKTFSDSEKRAIEIAENDFANDKNTANLRRLYKSWAPYYVPHAFLEDYFNMLDLTTFDVQLYEWGNSNFYEYFRTKTFLMDNIIAINSKFDIICPSSLFHKQPVQMNEINSSSHFPWISDKEALLEILKSIQNQATSNESSS